MNAQNNVCQANVLAPVHTCICMCINITNIQMHSNPSLVNLDFPLYKQRRSFAYRDLCRVQVIIQLLRSPLPLSSFRSSNRYILSLLRERWKERREKTKIFEADHAAHCCQGFSSARTFFRRSHRGWPGNRKHIIGLQTIVPHEYRIGCVLRSPFCSSLNQRWLPIRLNHKRLS